MELGYTDKARSLSHSPGTVLYHFKILELGRCRFTNPRGVWAKCLLSVIFIGVNFERG